ncbi:MAG: YetF domain-containing protein [Sneathiella sp.]
MWFESWQSILNILITGSVSFIGLIILLRTAGKRTLTKMNAFDFIMTFTIGSTLATTITSDDTTVSEGLTALAVIIFVQYMIAWLEVRSEWFQRLIKAQPSVLFHNGEFQEKTMKKERITKAEVLAAMRYSGLSDPSQARLVLMETNGQLSVIPDNGKESDLGVLRTVENFIPRTKAKNDP